LAASYGQRRLDRDFARLFQSGGTGLAATVPEPRPRVGVATFGSGGWHLTIEALLARALVQRGAAVELLVCDMPDLPVCDERTIYSQSRDRCPGCLADKRPLLDASGLPWRGVSTLVSPIALARARAATAGLSGASIEAFESRGWPIGRWLHVSACHFLRCDARGPEPEKLDAHRRLLTSAIVIVEAMERWLDEIRPDIVIAESGAHFMWRIALELAQARGIRVVCREMGKGGWDYHLYALNADCMSPNLIDEWSAVRDSPLTTNEAAQVEQFLSDLPGKTYGASVGRTNVAAASLRDRFGVKAGSPLAVAYTNVTWDLATAGRDVAFEGVFDWVRETIRVVTAPPNAHVIVRAHPAEAATETRERVLDQIAAAWPSGLPGLTLVGPEEPLAAGDLNRAADLVLAYNSSVAIEAAAEGHPVVVCGNPHFRGKGFTIDISSRADYARLLRQWAHGAPVTSPPGARELARSYAHLFFLRYHVPMGWTTSPLAPPFVLTIRSLDELSPGHNPALDLVCQSILEGRQMLLPRQPSA